MAYHQRVIRKGVFGEISKIQEELDELKDAEESGTKILAHCELADLYGAIRECALRKYGLTMEDLRKMADLTESSFRDGTRT